MLVLLIRFLVISDKLLVVFIYIYFDILKDGLCLYSLWSYVGHSVCPLSLGPQRKLFVCVVMIFYSQTESLHKYCRGGRDEGGFDREEKGSHFGFYFM